MIQVYDHMNDPHRNHYQQCDGHKNPEHFGKILFIGSDAFFHVFSFSCPRGLPGSPVTFEYIGMIPAPYLLTSLPEMRLYNQAKTALPISPSNSPQKKPITLPAGLMVNPR
jgi:hypothetical protein